MLVEVQDVDVRPPRPPRLDRAARYTLGDAQDLEEKQTVMHRSADKEGQRERREKKEKSEAAAEKARLKAETATYVDGRVGREREDVPEPEALTQRRRRPGDRRALDARGQSPHGPSEALRDTAMMTKLFI